MWKVSTTPPVYLFGTMHVPYSTLWSVIPENVKTAFSTSEEICLELELLDQDTLNELSSCRVIPRDGRIESLLPKELVTRVDRYLERVKAVLSEWMGYGSKGRSTLFGGVPTE